MQRSSSGPEISVEYPSDDRARNVFPASILYTSPRPSVKFKLETLGVGMYSYKSVTVDNLNSGICAITTILPSPEDTYEESSWYNSLTLAIAIL